MAYFSLTNLKGACISLIVGVFVYLVIVRLWLMKKEHEGAASKVYVNRWYRYLDLEDVVYRPVLLAILPAVFGFLCRILDSFVDTVVVILRKTIYKDSPLPHELAEGTPITHMCACVAEWFQSLGNMTFHKKCPKNIDYEHKFAMIYEEWHENGTIITRSMSFGLLLFCVGLVFTVAYLFLRDVFMLW